MARCTIFGSTSFAVDLHLLDLGGVGQPDVVERRHQEAGGTGRWVIHRVADPRVQHGDDGADDVARRSELAKLAGLLDLLQDVLEQIALGVGIGVIEAQMVDQRYHLRQHGWLVDHQTRAIHEVDRGAFGDFAVEWKHLVA